MDSNVRPGKTLDIVLDDAFCACGTWEVRLDNFEAPTLESAATLYQAREAIGRGVFAINCDDLRSHYRRHFNVEDSYLPKQEIPEEPVRIVGEDEELDDHWGDEYLEGEHDEESDFRPIVTPTAEDYLNWKLSILALIAGRFETIKKLQEAS